MSLNTGNMYIIPEDPAEDLMAEKYAERSLSVTETNICRAVKKVSSTSLPDKPYKTSTNNLNQNTSSASKLIAPKVKFECYDAIKDTNTRQREQHTDRLSISLIEFSRYGLTSPDSGPSELDKGAHTASSSKTSKSYLQVQDKISHSNQVPEYETFLSPECVTDRGLKESNFPANNNKTRKDSGNLIIIDLNEKPSERRRSSDHLTQPVGGLRQRSRSMQWIQNTFENVSNRYRYLLEFRRPSDIVEDRIHKSKEELEMNEHEYEILDTKPKPGGRRFSENVIGKQKRFPFSSRLKDLWKDKNAGSKRQEEKDNDQNRSDVCPLFNFPRKYDEDELILDALRQAMRKCTAVDPSSRPTSTLVLDQLSKLLD